MTAGQQSTEKKPPLVVHVAESYAGGVKVAIDDYVRNSPGHRHALLFTPREDAPLVDADFSSFEWAEPMPDGHLTRIRYVRRLVARTRPDVVHAHSSFGGGYVRLAASKRRERIVYTPHCYAFERQDLGKVPRSAYRLLERILLFNTTVIAACSPREAALSNTRRGRVDVVYVPNVIPPASADAPDHDDARQESAELPLLVGGGRASAQKDPRFFAAAVEALRRDHQELRAVWIGGDDDLRREFVAEDIEVTGWLSRDATLRLMGSATAYLHSARWEGFPLAILEASALRTPLIARRIPSFEGFDFPDPIDEPDEIVPIWKRLADPSVREQYTDAVQRALGGNTDLTQQRALHRAYGSGERGEER